MQRKNAFGLKYPKVYIDLGTKSTASERHRSGVRQDTCLKVLNVGVFSLTCSVDHALGCCCRSGKNVWCAASSGCSTRSGRAHRVDWQAARRRLFDRNHNAPVTNETQGHQPACEHKIPYQMLLGDILAVCAGESPPHDGCTGTVDESIVWASIFTVGLRHYNRTERN